MYYNHESWKIEVFHFLCYESFSRNLKVKERLKLLSIKEKTKTKTKTSGTLKWHLHCLSFSPKEANCVTEMSVQIVYLGDDSWKCQQVIGKVKQGRELIQQDFTIIHVPTPTDN